MGKGHAKKSGTPRQGNVQRGGETPPPAGCGWQRVTSGSAWIRFPPTTPSGKPTNADSYRGRPFGGRGTGWEGGALVSPFKREDKVFEGQQGIIDFIVWLYELSRGRIKGFEGQG